MDGCSGQAGDVGEPAWTPSPVLPKRGRSPSATILAFRFLKALHPFLVTEVWRCQGDDQVGGALKRK